MIISSRWFSFVGWFFLKEKRGCRVVVFIKRERAKKKRIEVFSTEEEEEKKKNMIGNYLSTFGVCVFAYLYPLFLCFKVNDDDDRNKALSFFAVCNSRPTRSLIIRNNNPPSSLLMSRIESFSPY